MRCCNQSCRWGGFRTPETNRKKKHERVPKRQLDETGETLVHVTLATQHKTSATAQLTPYHTCSMAPDCRTDHLAGDPVSLRQATPASCLRLTGVRATLVDCKSQESNDGRIDAEKNAVQDGGIATYTANIPTTCARDDGMAARTSGTAESWHCSYLGFAKHVPLALRLTPPHFREPPIPEK